MGSPTHFCESTLLNSSFKRSDSKHSDSLRHEVLALSRGLSLTFYVFNRTSTIIYYLPLIIVLMIGFNGVFFAGFFSAHKKVRPNLELNIICSYINAIVS